MRGSVGLRVFGPDLRRRERDMLLYFDWHALMLCGWQVGGVAALAWLGVAQLADARLCFIGCILTTIVSIGM